ncbi:MAG: DUF2851 family protein [Imperialibacter sp.]|uniref:DUF2851 family protein n=1 Tax=Imperialibacter sp. TaxID=2038411 RepID=UPI0032EF54A1
MFPEEFLHFIWQFQYFDSAELRTTDGQAILISKQGFLNSDAGPDFREARLRIGEMEWNGQVEIHLKSSDWHNHKHQFDKAYDSVVLHVVWEADREILRTDGTYVPQLELKDRVSLQLLSKYQGLIQQRVDVPCQTQIKNIDALKRQSMIDRVLVERLQRKTKDVEILLKKYGGDWDATAVHYLIRYFGFKKNEEGFQQLSKRVSYKVMKKLAFDKKDLEAYLLGLAGLLDDDSSDFYSKALKERFDYINHKFQLIATTLPPIPWKFMRMRPANFPTIRMAQLAAIIHQSPRLFAVFVESDLAGLRGVFKSKVSDYWLTHFQFAKDKPGTEKAKSSGQSAFVGSKSIDILLINCVVPLLFAYGKEQGSAELEEKALLLLNQLQFEENTITRKLSFMPVEKPTAYESQAFIELYQHYCQPRRCLSCQIGTHLIRQSH